MYTQTHTHATAVTRYRHCLLLSMSLFVFKQRTDVQKIRKNDIFKAWHLCSKVEILQHYENILKKMFITVQCASSHFI
jgi:hypothetical protein